MYVYVYSLYIDISWKSYKSWPLSYTFLTIYLINVQSKWSFDVHRGTIIQVEWHTTNHLIPIATAFDNHVNQLARRSRLYVERILPPAIIWSPSKCKIAWKMERLIGYSVVGYWKIFGENWNFYRSVRNVLHGISVYANKLSNYWWIYFKILRK